MIEGRDPSTPEAAAPAAALSGKVSNTYVLVHGAFHGGWCWVRVADRLRALGHRVFTPTLTGAGERAHLLNPSIDMQTFVQDILGVIESEELDDVILVGHSFGGGPVTGVADRIPERLRHLVFLDAAVAQSGVTMLSTLPNALMKARLRSAVRVGSTMCFPTPPASTCGITNECDILWVERRLTAMPARPYETALTLREPPGGNIPKTYVRCTAPAIQQPDLGARHAIANGWKYVELPTGHDAMITAPNDVASLLANVD